ncbi:MAG: UvrD-helicase domain-containing protein [Acidobacteriota bacterium]|nr:UvrD-helicase domain-containing protein [Acidobacteriota bacterium]
MDLENELNEQQLAAVTHGEGPQLVLAGAGSGKTRVITYRVAWLVQKLGVDPSSIVAVTFTNKAAGEMRDRIERLVGIYPLTTFVGTFHRFSLDLLRRYGDRVGISPDFIIFDRDDQISLVKKSLAAEGLAETSYPPRAVLASIGAAKNMLLAPEAFERQASNFYDQKIALVYRHYQGLLKKGMGVDFDDMLRLAVRLLLDDESLRERLRSRIHYLLVDEFQDTNHAQMKLIQTLAGEGGNLTAVGDEDQGIYRWRGADLDNVLEFESFFPGAEVRKLERNYRSSQNILSAAEGLVAHNQKRRGKRLWTQAGAGDPVELYRARDELDEARWIVNTMRQLHPEHKWSDMAVLVRTNAQTRALEERLLQEKVPYILVGGVRFYERAEVKDLVAYLRVLRNPRDDYSLLRILNRPPRGIGKATRELLAQKIEAVKQPIWDGLLHVEPSAYPKRGGQALVQFRDLILDLQQAMEELPLPALLDRLLDSTNFAEQYQKKENAESQAKLENIREFLTAAQEFTEERSGQEDTDVLTAFLDHASLVADIDQWNQERGVSLMTLHTAKGLEFLVVTVAGLEDGLLPHFNSQGVPEGLEEERRLLYVGMTRAEKKLFLSACRRRRIAGRYQDQEPSRFLDEIPPECVETTNSPELFADSRGAGVRSFFGRPRPAGPFAVEPSQAEGDGEVGRGRRVRHPVLGDGVVVATEGEGEASKLTVYFDRVGKRKLIVKYAGLEYL